MADPDSRSWPALAGFAAPVVAAAVVGGRFGPADPSVRRWYRGLDRPPFLPPDGVFGPVWTALYGTIAVSGWRVWRRPASRRRSAALALWAAQLAANAAWTPTFFGARRPRPALAVLAAQLGATVAYAAVASEVDRPAAALMGPYIGWTGFAGVLNAEIVRRN
jgi:benzodiazapine receptor